MTATQQGDVRDLDDPAGIDNPYWQAVRRLYGDPITAKFSGRWEPATYSDMDVRPVVRNRADLTRRYAWAITDPASVAFVADHIGDRGAVEIGAGTGYWAWQLSQRGVSVVAYDTDPPDQTPNTYFCEHDAPTTRAVFHPVIRGGPGMAAAMPGRALFLCWPPYATPMAAEALAAYSGDMVVYVGESAGGCNGDDRFHGALAAGWDEVADHRVVQWSGLRDWVTVYRRRP